MAETTYKDLYKLVQEQIAKSSQYNNSKRYQNQLDRTDVGPLFANPVSDVRATEIINSIQELLSRALPGFIVEGLEVEATEPVSNKVIVRAGRGSKGGVLFTLNQDITITVPFETSIDTLFVMLYRDRIIFEKNERENALTIAKIIVPEPSRIFEYGHFIYNKKEERHDELEPYIVGFKEYKIYGDSNGNFEEDTVELLRQNIGPILADNLIGNIRLSEDLKIINSQGTLSLDSNSMKLYNSSGGITAKFNKDGTFYYDSDGVEIARFGTEDAKIGNILITKNSIQSQDFVSESKGFIIRDTGYAEFENVRVRGRISSSVFEQDKISAVGGKLFIGKSSVVGSDMSASNSETLTVEDSSFSVGDILRIKEGTDEEYMEVTDDSSAPTYVVTRDLAGQYSTNNNPQWKTGTAIVSIGNGLSGQNGGFIMMDAVSEFSPFIDIASRNSTTYNDYDVKVRLGNLEGITDADFGGTLEGFGLYAENVYLKGCLFAPYIKTALSGSRIELNNNEFQSYNSSGTPAFGICLSGTDEGDVVIGDFAGGSGALWDSSTDTFCLRALLNADDIVTGSLSATRIGAGFLYLCDGITIATSPDGESGSGWTGRTEFNSNSIVSYDDNGNLAWCVRDGHMQAVDIRLQDPGCICCYSFLDAGKLKFHDELGPVPYVNRICSGNVSTGTTICLLGWKTAPEIIVGIKQLNSFDAGYVAQNQQWCIFHDNAVFYCNSSVDYGYCFAVHARLQLSTGTGGECVKNATFTSCVCTDVGVCATDVKMNFQLWCHGAAPANYCYGRLCYALCYRCLGCGVWCAVCFCYEQAHANITQMQTTTAETRTLTFPCSAQWEIMASQVSLTWVDSGIASGATNCFLCTRAITSCNVCCQLLNCITGGCNLCNRCCSITYCIPVTLAGTNPTTSCVFCTYMCYCSCSVSTCNLKALICWPFINPNSAELCAVSSMSFGVCSATGVTVLDNCTVTNCRCGTNCSYGCECNVSWSLTPHLNDFSGAQITRCYDGAFICYCFMGCITYPCLWSSTTCTLNVANICWQAGTLYQCYCVVSGSADGCSLMCIHSLQDTYAAQEILDPAGCVSWLAISYS